MLRYQIHLCGGMPVLFLGYVNEPPNSESAYPLWFCVSAFILPALRNFSRSRMAVSASRSSFSLFLSSFFSLRLVFIFNLGFLCKHNHRRAASRARRASPPKTAPMIAPTGGRLLVLRWSAEDTGADGERDGSDVEVAESAEVVEGDAEVESDLFEPPVVLADVDLVDGRDVGGVAVGRDALFSVLG